jgi:integrase
MATNFYIDKRTDKKGDAPIRMSINIRGARYLTSTGLKIAPGKWDVARQQARKGSTNATGMTWTTINSTLARIAEHFAMYESNCIAKDITPKTDDIKSEFARTFDRKRIADDAAADIPPVIEFWDYFKMFIDETSKKNQWTFATHQKFNALKKHLNEWRRKISFDDFTERGFNDFIAFLRDKKQMKNSTIGNQISFVKWFLRWVTLKGYNTNIAFQTFSPKLKTAQKHVVFLDWNELMKVFNYIVPNNGDEITLHDANGKEYKKIVHDAAAIVKARDIFCFCCFTSLRYSDAANLKRANLNGESLTITTIKTADTITVEINKYARAILDKYAERDDLGGYVFPAITNQRMNIYLKELCELCEINQPITQTYYRGAERIDETMPKYEMIGTHTGRRTFICNALMLGIPAEIVMKWTGLADYKSMKPYIDVTNNAKANAMNLFNKL